jgi:lipopolysaccharide transport system permease protein
MTPADLKTEVEAQALPAGSDNPPSGAPQIAGEPEETVIAPATGWQALHLKELWRCRDLLYFLTWRNIKVRYKQTVLGAAWAVLQPLLMMVVFTWAFGQEPLFLFAGLLPWIFFQTAVIGAANSVVSSEGLVSKVYFPRLTIPLSAVAAALVDFAVAFVVLLALMLWYGHMPGWSILLLPPALALTVIAALGVGTLIAALNVAYRDFRYVVTFLVQLWMFATPSIYSDLQQPAGSVSSVGRAVLIYVNPMTAVIEFFRGATLGTPIPWGHVALSSVSVCAMLAIGLFYFRRMEDSFADVI